MCGSMADIQSVTVEIKQEKKERRTKKTPNNTTRQKTTSAI